MSNWRNLIAGVIGIGLVSANAWASDPTRALPADSRHDGNLTETNVGVVSRHNLRVWRNEGDGNGKLAQYQPATGTDYYKIGSTPSTGAIAAWTIAITPSGAALPAASGTAAQGAVIYAGHCAMCHGSFGEGANNYPALVGGVGSLNTTSPQKTVGSYWPYATTVWDYINRAMPFYAPHTLKSHQVYALTAYILNMNGITKSDWVADAQSVPLVDMPNRQAFNWHDPRPLTHNTGCMAHCISAPSIKITSNADAMNLTPRLTGPVDHMKGGQ
jgi:mono/diheme cytochrome c family protein